MSQDLLTEDVLNTVEVNYDGSSTAAGIEIKINDVVSSLFTIRDNLTSDIDNDAGATIGLRDGVSQDGSFIASSTSFKIDSTLYFDTECANDGLVCVDLSGQGNNGVIELNGTDAEDFYLTE